MEHPAWEGWRFAGREIVSPDRLRVPADVLRHLIHMHHVRLHHERVGLAAMARSAKEKRSAGRQVPTSPKIVPLAAWRRRRD